MHYLAQANLAHMRAAQDDPLLADFVAQLDTINALAEVSPGFVWRYVSDTRDESQREFTDTRVLRWVPAGHIPHPDEAKEKLRLLGRKGSSPEAFTFKQAFSPAGMPLER
jgi:hypothetical protein